MWGGAHIDILSALIGGAVIGAIWMAFYLATDEDWREALLADPDEPYGDVPNVGELAADREDRFGGREARKQPAAGTHTDTRQVHTHGEGGC